MTRTLPRFLLSGFTALALALPALAEPPQVAELPEGWAMPTVTPHSEGPAPIVLAADDIGGAWHYETSNHMIVACDFPVWPLEPAAGDMEIAPHDGIVTATLVTGGNCDPESMCIFDGALEGTILAMANRDVVDGEGGVAANGWSVAFVSGDRAEGNGNSVYVHPEGARCHWSYTVTLTR